jgi:hypothetical protein
METQQNVALLRQGVVIVGEDEGRVAVAGLVDASEVPRQVLGDGVEIDLVGPTAREIWPRCCIGYREREPRRLQLRIALVRDEHVDEIVVAEDDETVVVYATVCRAVDPAGGDECDVPHHVYLEQPLGDRAVIDGTTGERLQLRRAPSLE